MSEYCRSKKPRTTSDHMFGNSRRVVRHEVYATRLRVFLTARHAAIPKPGDEPLSPGYVVAACPKPGRRCGGLNLFLRIVC